MYLSLSLMVKWPETCLREGIVDRLVLLLLINLKQADEITLLSFWRLNLRILFAKLVVLSYHLILLLAVRFHNKYTHMNTHKSYQCIIIIQCLLYLLYVNLDILFKILDFSLSVWYIYLVKFIHLFKYKYKSKCIKKRE